MKLVTKDLALTVDPARDVGVPAEMSRPGGADPSPRSGRLR
jgi:hypothetical protein